MIKHIKIQQYIKSTVLGLALLSCKQGSYDAPVASFNLPTINIIEGYKFQLDASPSFSLEDGQTLSYRWDFGDNSIWDIDWSSNPYATFIYPLDQTTNYYYWTYTPMTLQVKDEFEIMEVTSEIYGTRLNGLSNQTENNTNTLDYKSVDYIYNEEINRWGVNNVVITNNKIDPFNFKSAESIERFGSLIMWSDALTVPVNEQQLPSKEEWQSLIANSSGNSLAGYNLQIDNDNAIHLTLTGKVINGELKNNTEIGYYWTSTSSSITTAYAIKIEKNNDNIEIVELDKTTKIGVRLYSKHELQQ